VADDYEHVVDPSSANNRDHYMAATSLSAPAQGKSFTERAIDQLRILKEKGAFKDPQLVNLLRSAQELDSLRQRVDFKQILEGL
jgi:hypothetical protein